MKKLFIALMLMLYAGLNAQTFTFTCVVNEDVETFIESDTGIGDQNSDGDNIDSGVVHTEVVTFYQVVTDVDIIVNGVNLNSEWQTFAISYDREFTVELTTPGFPMAQAKLQVNDGSWTTIGELTTVENGYSFSLTAAQVAEYGDSNFNFKIYDDLGNSIDNSDIFFKIDVQTEAEFIAENPEPEELDTTGSPELDIPWFSDGNTYSIGDNIRIIVDGENLDTNTSYSVFLRSNFGGYTDSVTIDHSGQNGAGRWILNYSMPELPAGRRHHNWSVVVIATNEGFVADTRQGNQTIKHDQSN